MQESDDTTSAGATRPAWMRWRIVWLLMAFAGLNHFHRQSLPAVVGTVMHDCGFNEIDMGWIYSSFLSGYVAFMVVGGWLADRRGGYLALCLSGFGTAALVAATGCCGFLGSSAAIFLSLLVVRCLMGILTTPLFPAAGRVVSDWIPFQSRAWANGLVIGATTVGVSAAPIVFGPLSRFLGWRQACVAMGLVTAIVTLLWWRVGGTRPPECSTTESERSPTADHASQQTDLDAEHARDHPGFLTLLQNPSLLFLTLNYAAVGYYEYTLFYWIKHYFEVARKFKPETSEYFTAIVTSAMIVAVPLGGFLSDRLVQWWGYRAGRAAVPVFGMLSSAVLLYLAPRAQDPVWLVTLFFLAHGAIGLCEAPTWVTGLELGGRNCGTTAAIVNTGGNLGGLLAPIVTAYMAKHYGWNAGLFVPCVICLVGVVQWLGIKPNRV